MGYISKSQIEVENLLLNPNSVLNCDKCFESLGFINTIRSAFKKKKGEKYFVKCRHCGYLNERIKGKYKEEQKERWKKKKTDS